MVRRIIKMATVIIVATIVVGLLLVMANAMIDRMGIISMEISPSYVSLDSSYHNTDGTIAFFTRVYYREGMLELKGMVEIDASHLYEIQIRPVFLTDRDDSPVVNLLLAKKQKDFPFHDAPGS